MDSDKTIIEQKNDKKAPETNSMGVDQVAKNYIEIATSMPMISGALSYISSTYNSVKETNETVAPLMEGVEKSVGRVASAAFSISKQVSGSNYFENSACKGLDETDSAVPQSDISTVQKSPTESMWNNRISQTILNASNKALDATVTAVDSYLSPDDEINTNEDQNRHMSARISSVAGKARKRLIDIVSESPDKTNEDQQDTQSVNKETPESKGWLANVYKNLQKGQKNESLIVSVLRFSVLVSIKVTLTIQEAIIEPNKPFINRTFYSMVANMKEAYLKMLIPIKDSLDRATVPLKTASREALDASLEKSTEWLNYLKGLGFQMTADAMNYAKTLPGKAYKELRHIFQELSNSRREPSVAQQ